MTQQPPGAENPAVWVLLKRGLNSRCPQCGEGKLFYGWNKVVESCPSCGCELERRGEESWFFTYMSTAFLTGLIVLFMLFFRLPNFALQLGIVILGWFVLIVLSLPVRKSVGIAIDYYIDIKSGEDGKR